MKTSRTFRCDPESIRPARRFVLEAVGTSPSELRDTIAVMAGELVMNAVQHARTEFQVTVELTGATVRVEVTDSGGGLPAAGPMPPPGSPHGRGLPIVDSLADDWGVIPAHQGLGKGIWFQIAMPSVFAERRT